MGSQKWQVPSRRRESDVNLLKKLLTRYQVASVKWPGGDYEEHDKIKLLIIQFNALCTCVYLIVSYSVDSTIIMGALYAHSDHVCSNFHHKLRDIQPGSITFNSTHTPTNYGTIIAQIPKVPVGLLNRWCSSIISQLAQSCSLPNSGVSTSSIHNALQS